MKRSIVLTLFAVLATGCAAEFGEDPQAPQPTENEESQAGSIRTFGGRMQRPAEAIGTVNGAPTEPESTQLYELFQNVDQASVELGPKYSRSTK